jgi:hypothetical protein
VKATSRDSEARIAANWEIKNKIYENMPDNKT